MQNVSRTSTQITANEAINANDSFGNRTAHLNDDVLSAKLPDRSWGEFAQVVARRVGLGTAMIGAGLGLTGFGGVDEKKADAGIVISSDPLADQRAKDNGTARSVEGGGNVGSFTLRSDTGTFYSSLVFVNPFTAISSAHQFDSRFGANQNYSVGTGANYNSGPYYDLASIFIHPGYGGSAGQGVDLAVITFNIPVSGVSNVEFASGRPGLNESVWIAGYGVTGSRDRGYVGQDGFIRAGTSEARLSSPLLGGDPLLYQNTLFADFFDNPNGLRSGIGDSGGGVFTPDGRLTGIIIGGSTDVSGSTSMFLSTSAPTVRDFIDSHLTAVPEPSSLALLGSLAAAGAAYRVLRNRNKS